MPRISCFADCRDVEDGPRSAMAPASRHATLWDVVNICVANHALTDTPSLCLEVDTSDGDGRENGISGRGSTRGPTRLVLPWMGGGVA